MLIKGISEGAEEVGLHTVDPMGIREIFESHFQPLSSEELYDLAQQFTEQQKEDEDEGFVEPKQSRQRTLLIFFPL